MTVAAQLFRLEQLDSEIAGNQATLATLRRRQRRDPEAEAAETQRETARRQATEAAAEQRRLEGDLADLEVRIARDHTRLYGGAIVDPRELAAVERELEHLRARRGDLEEQVLTTMERAESAQAEADRSTRQATALHDQRERNLPDMTRQAEEITATLERLQAAREDLASSLEPRELAQYERLRQTVGNAVVEIAGGACAGCRLALPAKDIQHARAGAVATCPNCGRILHG